MPSLQAARQDWAAGVCSRTVHASVNRAVGVYLAGARVFPLVDAPAGRILRGTSFEQLWRGATANNGRARSRARSESGVNNSGENGQEQRVTTAKYSGRNRGFPRSRAICPLLFLLQITARTAK